MQWLLHKHNKNKVVWAKITHHKNHVMDLVLWVWTYMNRSFKWGTEDSFWSRGCKNIKGEIWRSKKKSLTRTDSRLMHPRPGPNRYMFFFYLQFWPLIFLQPLDQNLCLVLYFKDLFHICLELEDQSHGMTFSKVILAQIENPTSLLLWLE